ncbi:MAG: HAD family phosphatase [Blautia sp.]|nr:HAD family phosphatase [Blautia sp.]
MKNPKRILALLAVILLLAVCAMPMVFAFGKGENAGNLFRLSIGLVIAVPVLAYICMMAVKLWGNKREKDEGMIKNVIFDVGNVLLSYDWEDYLASFGFSQEVYEKIADATFRSQTWVQRDKGDFDEETYRREFVENAPEYEKEILEVIEGSWKCLSLKEYAVSWVKYLRSQGYHLYVLSNYCAYILEKTEKIMGFLPYMDGVVFSCREKQIKPYPEIYNTLLDRYHLKSGECVFLDDTLANCTGAQDLGIRAIHFTSFEQAVRELESIGVK